MSIFDDAERKESVFASANDSTLPTQPNSSRRPKTFSEWQQVRRELGSRYYSPRIQSVMQQDATLLGSAFFDQKEKEPWE